jgi:hypothetical protein
MLPNNRDAGYIWDMLQAARRLQDFTAGLSYSLPTIRLGNVNG